MALANQWSHMYEGGTPLPDWPCDEWAAVTPNDSADLAWMARALNVSQDCDIKVDTLKCTGITLTLTKGINYLFVTRVYATGLTSGTTVRMGR